MMKKFKHFFVENKYFVELCHIFFLHKTEKESILKNMWETTGEVTKAAISGLKTGKCILTPTRYSTPLAPKENIWYNTNVLHMFSSARQPMAQNDRMGGKTTCSIPIKRRVCSAVATLSCSAAFCCLLQYFF